MSRRAGEPVWNRRSLVGRKPKKPRKTKKNSIVAKITIKATIELSLLVVVVKVAAIVHHAG
jgi:hypothetical protein